MRRAVWLVVPVLLTSACGGSTEEPQQSTNEESCPGGQIRFLQGQPTDLPGGGSGGIGQYFDTRPPTVGLALGGDQVQAKPHLAVGDTFSVAGTTYRVTCISRSKVNVEQAS